MKHKSDHSNTVTEINGRVICHSRLVYVVLPWCLRPAMSPVTPAKRISNKVSARSLITPITLSPPGPKERERKKQPDTKETLFLQTNGQNKVWDKLLWICDNKTWQGDGQKWQSSLAVIWSELHKHACVNNPLIMKKRKLLLWPLWKRLAIRLG